MKRWPTKPLGEVAQVTAGDPAPQRAEDFSDDGIPFVRMQDVGRFGQTTCLAETKDRLSASASPKFKRFPAGSILVPKSGASIRLNHRAILGIEAHVVSHLAVIVPQTSLNTRFAYYWLCGIDLSGAAHDADLPSMKTSELAKLQIPVPPLAEQERIAKLLDEADELRKLRAQADRRSAALIPALFHEMFGDPATNSKGWPTCTIGSLVSEVRGGASLEPDDFIESGFPILHKGAIKPAGKISIDAKKKTFAPFEFAAANGRSRVNRDFIAVTLRDLVPSGPSIGLATDLRNGPFDEYLLAQGAYGFILDESRCCREYFVWLSNMPSFRYELKRNSVGSTQIHIRTPVYLKIPIPLPPLPLQQEFAQRVSEICEMEATQAASRQRVEHLFQSMLHRAFNQAL